MGRLARDSTIAQANEQMRAISPGALDATIPPGYNAGLVEVSPFASVSCLPLEASAG